MKRITTSKILLSIKTILVMSLLGLLIIMLSSCITDIEETYDYTVDDLLNKNFWSMDETFRDGPPRVRIMFDNPGFKIEEDNYAYDPTTGSYKYLHTLNIFGTITKKFNTDDFQVIEFHINNFVAPGYKYYRIKSESYDGDDCLMLVEMKQQQHWNSSLNKYVMEWVEWWHGDTTYLKEY